MIARLPTLLFYPVLLLWCLLFGAPAGALFRLLAVWEGWLDMNRYHYTLWKKYPQLSYRKYISSIWASEVRGLPLEMAEYTRYRVEHRHPNEPFPFARILANTLLLLCISPYMIVTGLILGPLYVYHSEIRKRQQLQTS